MNENKREKDQSNNKGKKKTMNEKSLLTLEKKIENCRIISM